MQKILPNNYLDDLKASLSDIHKNIKGVVDNNATEGLEYIIEKTDESDKTLETVTSSWTNKLQIEDYKLESFNETTVELLERVETSITNELFDVLQKKSDSIEQDTISSLKEAYESTKALKTFIRQSEFREFIER